MGQEDCKTGVIQVGEDSDLDLMMEKLKDMSDWGRLRHQVEMRTCGARKGKWEACLIIIGSIFL